MNTVNPDDGHKVNNNSKKTWGSRLKTSLLVGLILTIIWAVVVIAAGGYNPNSAEGISGLLGNAFGIFIVLTIISFIVNSIWYFIMKAKT